VDSSKKYVISKGVDTRDHVVPEKQKTVTVITLEESTTDPWILFLYSLKAHATRGKYIQRLIKFLDFLGYQGTKEETARAFTSKTRGDPNCAFNFVLKLLQCKREQIDRKEISIGTDRNCVKSSNLFSDMADPQIPWTKIGGVKSINHA
jgi:hypothetical protein